MTFGGTLGSDAHCDRQAQRQGFRCWSGWRGPEADQLFAGGAPGFGSLCAGWVDDGLSPFSFWLRSGGHGKGSVVGVVGQDSRQTSCSLVVLRARVCATNTTTSTRTSTITTISISHWCHTWAKGTRINFHGIATKAPFSLVHNLQPST